MEKVIDLKIPLLTELTSVQNVSPKNSNIVETERSGVSAVTLQINNVNHDPSKDNEKDLKAVRKLLKSRR